MRSLVNQALVVSIITLVWSTAPRGQTLPPSFLCVGSRPITQAGPTTQEISVTSEVDKDRITRAESITLTITISDELAGTPRVELPDLKDFLILSKKSSQNISIKGKKSIYFSEFTFLLQPKSEGLFTIGPAKVRYKGKAYKTQPIVVEVIPGEPAPEGPRPPEERKPPKLEGGIII